VKYYDLAFGISGEAELDWYLHKAYSSGGPVLDLACGTGRLAILLAEKGFEVHAIDQSEGMLHQFKAKLAHQPALVRHRIYLSKQDMSNFNLQLKFNTIICCDSFFHNLTSDTQKSCFQRVGHHLAPTGRFVFNLPNPTQEFIHKAQSSMGHKFEPRGRYNLPEHSGTLLVEQSNTANTQDQIITTFLRYTRYDPDGRVVEKGESSWKSCYLYQAQVERLLDQCGFQVV
jgi:ubiquinone/menaquinone biosynthesis C-methylase UbiE